MKLTEIADLESNGATEWTETITENGKTYTRRIMWAAAIATAARLLQAVSSGTRSSLADQHKAQTIINLAQWRKKVSPQWAKQKNLPKSADRRPPAP